MDHYAPPSSVDKDTAALTDTASFKFLVFLLMSLDLRCFLQHLSAECYENHDHIIDPLSAPVHRQKVLTLVTSCKAVWTISRCGGIQHCEQSPKFYHAPYSENSILCRGNTRHVVDAV
jgi:hypothetical protein